MDTKKKILDQITVIENELHLRKNGNSGDESDPEISLFLQIRDVLSEELQKYLLTPPEGLSYSELN